MNAGEREVKAYDLLREAFRLRQLGERPPGAPPWPAETWHDWDKRCEEFLRSDV
jgi:broad specificity phosphatase PhoE